ncbi:MAG: CPBP family intramembrane metalloprotease [Oscillospiraceae bacterium]|nr:CPBP family intramembrane metalloprotease [Oscillospiraceae bacterium]
MVWGISFVCYLPTLLEKNGIDVPKAFIATKYLFVIVPLVVSVIFVSLRSEFKKWFAELFAEKIWLKSILFCAATGAVGLSFSFVYSLVAGERGLFADAFPSVLSVIAGCAYLYVTALAEESAWRAFLLNKLSSVKGELFALIYTSVVWAVWHIPMWTIRNSLGVGETALYFSWTILISLVFGKFYLTYNNLITTALIHMLFNVCFIAPVQYNVILAVVGVAAMFPFFMREHRKR